MIGYIYLITDTTNGKQYVGQHHYDKEELDSNYHGSGNIVRRIFEKSARAHPVGAGSREPHL